MKLSRWMRGFRKSFDDQLSSPGAVIAIAQAAGCVITADELMKAQIEHLEEELEGVVGGFIQYPLGIDAGLDDVWIG